MLKRLVFAVSILATTLALGCGSKDDNEPPPRSAPQQKCDALIDLWCTHALDCAVQAALITSADEPTEHSACVSAAKSTCDGAIAVESGYDECMSEIDTYDCSVIVSGIQNKNLALPSVCSGVIGT